MISPLINALWPRLTDTLKQEIIALGGLIVKANWMLLCSRVCARGVSTLRAVLSCRTVEDVIDLTETTTEDSSAVEADQARISSDIVEIKIRAANVML